ncbi:hypothetical protein WA026_009352 [Henosepilachna vigintioctopunctata]|uniref:Amino acid transporter transmembrane domain-containing protein n=1 Tax=Henosepilachna vigintioctopunctata TaxID=420089 RepID=A0AAW1U4F4_9CUCU
MENNFRNNITLDKNNDRYPSTFTIDNFSSTTTLTPNEIKIPIGSKDSLNEKLYDPHEHRDLEHPNTFYGALMHLVKSSMGTGTLAVPMAFKYAGLLVGIFGTMMIGLLCAHTVHILVLASYKVCIASKVPSMGFAETAEAVFKFGPKPFRPWASYARMFVDIGLTLCNFFGNAVYVVFIRDSLRQVMQFYYPDINIPATTLVLGITILLIFFCQIRPLKFLVPFSAVANMTMLIAFAIIFYYMIETIPKVNFEERYLVKGIDGIPKFMVTIIFAMEGIGTIMPVENSMKKPQFIGCPGVLNVGNGILVFIFSVIGFFGYYAFGENTQASVTYSLPEQENIAMIGRACIATAIFFTYMLQFYVPMEITWRNVSPYVPSKYENIFQIVYRTVAVIFVSTIAIVVPDLSTIIDIVGSVFLSTLGLFIPCLLDIIVNWESGHGRLQWKLYKNLLIMCISLFMLYSGVHYAVS